jgi:hypothetical protein
MDIGFYFVLGGGAGKQDNGVYVATRVSCQF